jgi:SPP1 family predicted phage head-tail adaptor
MNAGPKRFRITIETLTETRDPYGQNIPSWTAAGTFWAQIRNLAGREAVNAKQVNAVATHAVTMRYVGGLFPPHGIQPSARIIFGLKTFNIVWVDDYENRHRQYNLLVQEIPLPVPAP